MSGMLSGISRALRVVSVSAARAAAARPRLVLPLWALAVVLALPGLTWLERNTDGHALVPLTAPAIAVDRQIRGRFDLRDQIIVYIDAGKPNAILDPLVLHDVGLLTERLRLIEGVGRGQVTGLGTEVRDRLYDGTGRTYGTFLSPLPSDDDAVASLKTDLAAAPARLLTGSIVSSDRSATAVLVGVPYESSARDRVVREVDEIVAPFRRRDLSIDVVGSPAASVLLSDHILRDLALLIPLSMLASSMIIWLGTRRLATVALAQVKVGSCIVWTFGVMGALGIPIYLPVVIVPVVLASMCIADEVHLFVTFQRELAHLHHGGRALAATIDKVSTPVVVATSTTCVGFLSCGVAAIEPIRALGLSAALGIGYSLVFSLTVTPALLGVLPLHLLEHPRPWPARQDIAEPSRIVRWSLARPVATIAILLCVTVVAIAGASRARIQDSWLDCFGKNSSFRRASDRVNHALNGVHVLYAHLTFRSSETSLLDPDTLRAIQSFEQFAHDGPTVGAAIGPSAHLDAVAAFWRLPQWNRDRSEIEHLLTRFDFAPGVEKRQRVVSDDRSETIVSLFLKNANYRDTEQLIAGLTRYHEDHLAPLGSELSFAGDIAVSQAMIPAIVQAQILSLPLALVGVFLSIVLLCGSIRLAFLALLPVLIGALWLLGALGWTGVPLGVATSMFFVISIGLGVDSHAVHLIVRYQQLERTGAASAIRAAVADVEPAIVVNSLAVAVGFGLMAFSTVPTNRSLGVLIASSVILGCGLTLTGLVATLVVSRRSGANADSIGRRVSHATSVSVAAVTQEGTPPSIGRLR